MKRLENPFFEEPQTDLILKNRLAAVKKEREGN
jgi:hypothetical protein